MTKPQKGNRSPWESKKECFFLSADQCHFHLEGGKMRIFHCFFAMDEMFVPLPKCICWRPTPPKVMLFGDRAFGKYLGLDEVMRVGPLDTWDQCLCKRKKDQNSLSLSREQTARRWSSASQGKALLSITESASTLIFEFSASRIVRNRCLLFKPPCL